MTGQQHIALRKLEPDDLPWLYQWENDAEAWAEGDTHNPLSKADLRDYILRTTGDIYQDGQLRLVICLQSDADKAESGAEQTSIPVGCIDLYDVDIRNRKAAVAVYIDPKYRHRGLAAQALRLIKTYAATVICFRLLYALVREDNKISFSLFQSAEFQQVACLPNWVNEGNILVLQTIL